MLSDEIAFQLVGHNNERFKQISTYKGWLYIGITALLIFFLIIRRIRIINNMKVELLKSYEELAATYEELHSGKEELDVLAFYDTITGLPNRTFLS